MKQLCANEVTDPGWYWYREEGKGWRIVEVAEWPAGSGQVEFLHSGNELPDYATDLPGTFIGPLRAPE